jgi:hypothetical protein
MYRMEVESKWVYENVIGESGRKQNVILPPDAPYYLVSVISMIMRDGLGKESGVKKIIKQDPLLEKVLFTNDYEDTYDYILIVMIARIFQEAYGIEFIGLGPFTRNGVGTFIDFLRRKHHTIIHRAIALIWNYSPCVDATGTLMIEKHETEEGDY